MIRILLVMSCIVVFAVSVFGAITEKRTAAGLKGFIDHVYDYSIRSFDLLTLKNRTITKKRPGISIGEFDTMPDGQIKIIILQNLDDGMTQMVRYESAEKAQPIINKKFIAWPAVSPTGKLIAYLYSDYSKGDKWKSDWFLYSVNNNGQTDVKLSERALDRCKPSWFPNGKQIAVSSVNYKIYVIDINSKKENVVIDFGTCPSVSHDGNQIAYFSHEIDESLRKKIVAYRNMTSDEYNQMVSNKMGHKYRDYSRIENAYFVRKAIYILNIKSGISKRVSEGLSVNDSVIWSPDDNYLLLNNEGSINTKMNILDIRSGKLMEIPDVAGSAMVWRK
ncbi:MAG: PD40 domain-containing protein [Nitrospirae bacterium]|nr:PD40 domain-containing protein [Nitrospirota bacterium]